MLRSYPLTQVKLVVFEPSCVEGHTEELERMLQTTSSKDLLVKLYVLEPPTISRAEIEAMASVLQECQTISRLVAFKWKHSDRAKVEADELLKREEIDQVLEREDSPVGAWTRAGGWSWGPEKAA